MSSTHSVSLFFVLSLFFGILVMNDRNFNNTSYSAGLLTWRKSKHRMSAIANEMARIETGCAIVMDHDFLAQQTPDTEIILQFSLIHLFVRVDLR